MRAILLAALLFSLEAHASAVDRLNEFVKATHTLKAHFVQSVYNSKMDQTQNAEGEMMFSRPGKFRWVYDKPYAQILVGDGEKLWTYDEDLEQVTVRKLDRAIGSSPAALLAGDNEIGKAFVLSDGGTKEGMEWVEASPKGKESNFQSLKLGFSGKFLSVMVLKDYFGQVTIIHFSDMKLNPVIPASTFHFTPPKGADVIGE
ncbi:MAG: outer membrane lipoprotein chaperone LolA [Burkholderiales bacterium]|nr:outer membrane lipoprotein chaperone LolA [Burkholderiales bacterium]